IGHLESAAGVAGLIKAVLVLQNGQIPPHLHLKTPNPLLRMESIPFIIPTQLASWPQSEIPRRAGVSSFGFGGTNAHIVLEESPLAAPVAVQAERPLHVLSLSGRSSAARAELAARYADCLGAQPEISLADTAFTAHVGRMHFASRLAVVAESPEQASARLRAFVADPTAVGTHAGEAAPGGVPKVAFLFTGQGAQYAGMGLGLHETQPVFREILDHGAACLRPYLDRPLLSLLDPAAGAALDQTGYTQPVMFCLQYALAMLWRSWGVEPTAVMGHSVGEFAAACVAGVFSFEDGLRLIAERARLMQALPRGGLMAAVMATPDRIQEALRDAGDQVVIAALNGPQSVVVSGPEAAVREVLARFEADGTKCKILATSHAFHSQFMDPILGALDEIAASVPHAPPTLPIVANLLGEFASADTYSSPDYWSRHARSPVRFAAGMQALADSGCEIFLEIGPRPILLGMGRRCLPDERLAWLPSLRPGTNEWATLLDSLAGLYVRGANVDWAGFDRDSGRQRIAVPTYPFQRRRYWAKGAVVLPADGRAARDVAPGGHSLLGRRLIAAVPEGIFEGQIAANRPAYLADHKVQGKIVLPGAGLLEMALAASATWQGTAPWTLRGVAFLSPLMLDKSASTVQTVLTPDGPGAATFRIVSMTQTDDDEPDETSLITHATGRLEAPSNSVPGNVDLRAEQARFPGDPFDDEWRTQAARRSKLEYGPTFCWVKGHWVQEREALAECRAPNDKDHASEYHIHPGLLDCAFQLAG
ncbi:MAG: type I polyketide synthase, partial [Victivallales bacterium]|nr:type I polyketide synthase [Victivallales bacterium]